MVNKVISVSQMATVLGVSLTAIREGIARDRFPFAYAWQSPGKKSRSFVIDKEGFRTFLIHSLGWDVKAVDAEFKSAGIHQEELIMTWIDAGMHLSFATAAVASILSMMML